MTLPSANWFVEQFDKYHIRPEIGHTDVVNGAACAIGVAFISVGIESEDVERYRVLEQKLGITLSEALGIMDGFDRTPGGFESYPKINYKEYTAGYTLGDAVARQCLYLRSIELPEVTIW